MTFPRSPLCLISILSFASVAGGPALADTAVLSPVRDNTLYEDSAGSFSNGAGDYLFAGSTARGSIRRALLAFETQQRGLGFSMVELLSSCPTNWKVTPNEALKFVGEQMLPVFPLGDYKKIPELAELKV